MNLSVHFREEVQNFHPKIRNELQTFIYKHRAGKRMLVDRSKLTWFKNEYIKKKYNHTDDYEMRLLMKDYDWNKDEPTEEALIYLAVSTI